MPMLLSCILNTLFPDFLRMGDPMTAIFTSKGTMTVCGILLFTNGTQLKLKNMPAVLKRCGSLIGLKLVITITTGLIFFSVFGISGFCGISIIAFVATICGTNPGVHLALMNTYGDNIDSAAFGPLNLLVAPAVPATLVLLCVGESCDMSALVATFVPFIVGILIGNLDNDMSDLFKNSNNIILPFMGICLGAGINLTSAVNAGLPGLVLTCIFYMINFFPLVIFDRKVLGQRGHSGAALCSASGLSLVVPTLLSSINPIFAPYAQAALSQQALVVVITAFLTPFLTRWLVSWDKKKTEQ